MVALRSPLPWIGGKHYSARHILQAFPHHKSYDVYCDLFGGAAHVLIQKPTYKHVEVYNDINNDLVNFWMQCRDHAGELEERCRSLPYARSLYYEYQKSLFDGTKIEPLERAVRWFYVLRSSFAGHHRSSPNGWQAGCKDPNHGSGHAYHGAIDLFAQLSKRMQRVQIDNRDFADVFAMWNTSRTLFYVDPPYIDAEHYYEDAFTLQDHQRLAALLNSTSAYVALSYYPHPLLDELYPADKWHRITWETFKHSQRTKETHDVATEMFLTNYAPAALDLWEVAL
jgi:DNA adenine methylase